MDSEETEQMKAHRAFVGGGTDLDLSERAAAVIKSVGARGPAAAAADWTPLLSRQESATTTPDHTTLLKSEN